MAAVVSEFEGILLKNPNPFCYFMLVAFEASGLIRFASLLLLWPVIRLFDIFGLDELSLKLMIFVSTVGVHVSEIDSVARAVLPKFYMDDLDTEAWKVFSSCDRKVVVTKTPRLMVERFGKDHLRATEVFGSELTVNRFGFATGFVKGDIVDSISSRVANMFSGDQQPDLGLGRASSGFSWVMSLTNEQMETPFTNRNINQNDEQLLDPIPVIFHDGRLVKCPTPSTALVILLWIPIGITLAIIRISLGLILPMWLIPYSSRIFGENVIVRGKPPSKSSGSNNGVLFVCTHRTLMDPVILSYVLGRKIPALTYSLSRFSEIISPIPTVRLTRIRDVDAKKINRQLSKGDLVVCPEGTTCREPFLLRFSALFAELTDRIVPVAMNYKVTFFHATTARGWKCLDPIFFFMNPSPVYEVTFLNELLAENTCSAGKSPHDVANYVQRILATTLGFECTNYTRKDKYRVLAGNDGTVSYTSFFHQIKKLIIPFKSFLY